jgi:hypothetical protein
MCSGHQTGITILERRGEEYRPVAAVKGFEAALTIDGTQKGVHDSTLGTRRMLPDWYPEFFKGKALNRSLVWNDLDGDGMVQEKEVAWSPSDMPRFSSGFWGDAIGPDMELYTGSQDGTVYRLDPEFTAEGLPRYSFKRCHPFIRDTGGVSSLFATDSGKLYVTKRTSPPGRRGGDQTIAEKAMTCYDRDGRELWSLAGPRDLDPKTIYGEVNAQFSYPELGSGVATWVWWFNNRAYLLSDDGLYLGGFLKPGIGPEKASNEASNYAAQGPDGRLYLINGNDSGHHFMEIKGLETARRFEQKLTITPADAAAATRALESDLEPVKEKAPIWVRHVKTAPRMDGSLDRWDLEEEGAPLISPNDRPGRGGRIALKTDGKNLYIAARIKDETPMVNNGSNWQTPFITGDVLDLMLATDPTADPDRRAPVAGDLRLLFTELRGEPLAVLHRPVAPGAKDPVRLRSATIDYL